MFVKKDSVQHFYDHEKDLKRSVAAYLLFQTFQENHQVFLQTSDDLQLRSVYQKIGFT